MRRLKGNMKGTSWLIDEAIKAFKTKYPKQWVRFGEEQKLLRTTRKDKKFATNVSKSMRWAASFPVVWDYQKESEQSLLFVLQKIDPEIVKDDKKLKGLLEKYPIFKIATKR